MKSQLTMNADQRAAARRLTGKAIETLGQLLVLDNRTSVGFLTAQQHNELFKAVEMLRTVEVE